LKRTIFLYVALLTCCLPIYAAESAKPDSPELQTRYQYYYAHYYLNADGSHVETHDWATTILQERAVEGSKRASVSYSTSIQKVEVLHAYTLKADGRRIEVPKSNYQLEVNSGKDKDAPVFSDYTTLTVVFPDVVVGDSVAFAYKLTQTEAIFPGMFSALGTFPKIYAYDDVKISVDAPAALWLQYEAREMTQKRREQDGRVLLEWTFQNKQPIKSKRRDWSVYDIEKEPGYAISTFKSYADISAAYGLRARPKAVVTERIQKLADEIVKERTAPREQARVLYDWVATNITYAGNCIGVGAVVPHDVSFIIDNRMGDCKDHATLLQALLAAKGIDSTQALINAGSTYRLQKIPVVSTVNHVINYLPGLNLFVDSTSSTTPFGMLPFSSAGKPVLLVDGFKEGMRTPTSAVNTNRQTMQSVIRIDAEGNAHGNIDVNLKGEFAVGARARFRFAPKDQDEEFVKHALSRMGFVGSGQFIKDDPKALLDSYHYKVAFDIKEWVLLPGPAAFAIYPLFSGDAPIQSFLGAVTEPDETVDTTCTNGTSIEEYVYHFPKNMRVLAAPKNMTISNEFLSYQASYRLKGNTLWVKRVLDDKVPGNICSPAVANAYKKLASQIAKNVKAQVVYK
jgi:transglutaminase-like putative cysteine protease